MAASRSRRKVGCVCGELQEEGGRGGGEAIGLGAIAKGGKTPQQQQQQRKTTTQTAH